MTKFQSEVYAITSSIPVGKVVTYLDIAKKLGKPSSSRAVGNALHLNPFKGTIPCHRVVNRDGYLALNFAFDGSIGQQSLLEREGVKVVKGRVDLSIYRVEL